MPSKKKTALEAKTELPSILKELIDQFVKGPMTAEAIQDASMAFKKALIERALGAELPEESNNQRNGKSGKTVLTDDGPLRLEIPRNRDGSFAPVSTPAKQNEPRWPVKPLTHSPEQTLSTHRHAQVPTCPWRCASVG